MSVGFPASANTYIPSFDATGKLVVAFSRNPKDFALNKWITLTPVKKMSGYYLRITAEQAARVAPNTNLSQNVWHPGNDAPTGEWNRESFEFFPYQTTRYAYPFRIPTESADQADWKIVASHAAMQAQVAMTARTQLAVTEALTSGNYASNHVQTATAWCGGSLNTGTPADPRLKKALNAMARRVQLDTLGAVGPKDLHVVINPVLADELSRSEEVHSYLKESPFALSQVRGDSPSQNGKWGLPDQLYGFGIVVEDAVRVSTKKKVSGSPTTAYVWPDATLAMFARPGELTAMEGVPSYSTVHIFAYEEMTVEQKDDVDNRRIQGRVVENFVPKVVAPASGCISTSSI